HMSEVGVAAGAAYFDALHAMAGILQFLDRVVAYRLEVARPAAAGIVLGVGVEQRRLAAGAVVDSRRASGVVLAAERTLGAAQTADLELFGREFLAPGVEGFVDLVHCGSGNVIRPDGKCRP